LHLVGRHLQLYYNERIDERQDELESTFLFSSPEFKFRVVMPYIFLGGDW